MNTWISTMVAVAALAHVAAASERSKIPTTHAVINFKVVNDTFLRLKLGSSQNDVKKTGAKIFEVNSTTQFRGAVFSVAFLPVEPVGTFKRTIYFHEEAGLYRVRWEIGNPEKNNIFSGPELFVRWKEIHTAFRDANPDAKLISHSFPDVHDINYNELRDCPKGSDSIRDKLARVTEDEFRTFLTTALDAKPGESCGPKCLTFAIICGVTKSFRAQYLVAPDQTVHLSSSTNSSGGSTIIVVFANKRIADVMFDKGRRASD